MKHKKERISNRAIEHSSRGTFTVGNKNNKPRLFSGGHGEENLKTLKKYGLRYNIVAQYPNGVRLGNIPSHKKPRNQKGEWQVWFPKSWTRNIIKKAGEKTINSIPYKLPDGFHMYGTYKKVKVGVIRTKGKVATIYPYHKQRGSRKRER